MMIQQVNPQQGNDKIREPVPFKGSRVIHFHPTLKCNLKCKHCYSSSAPDQETLVQAADMKVFLDYAKAYDFNTLSVSGGEPFMYQSLKEVLTDSKLLGLRNLVASNGMLLKSKRNQDILPLIDVIAISIDGDEALHDQIRNQNGAFRKMIEGIELLSSLGQNFGLIHTITPESLTLLPWLVEFAHKAGAKLLQLHPLEFYGRAQEYFDESWIAQQLLHKVFILGNYYKAKYHPDMSIQLDFLHQAYVEEQPGAVGYLGTNFNISKSNFAHALKTVVVDENGVVYPISYGFSSKYNIGTIQEVLSGVDIFERFMNTTWMALYTLLGQTYEEITSEHYNQDMIAWTELIVKKSYQALA